jgi:hypothetical protein
MISSEIAGESDGYMELEKNHIASSLTSLAQKEKDVAAGETTL